MSENVRKMATFRQIGAVMPIPNADSICAYHVDGWVVVDRIGAYEVGDWVIYCEIDSWIPNEIAPFLSKGKEPREYNGVKGERLRTAKFKKTVSQGLLLPTDVLGDAIYVEDADLSEPLGIQKYDPPLPACLRGVAKGNFPSFIRKTDEERIQNLRKEFDEWVERNVHFEVSEKLNGSSMTVYHKDGEIGVCSRNIDLKETEGNSFWEAARKYNIPDKLLSLGRNIAVQGELIGEGIQGNPYKMTGREFFLFNVFDIDKQEYVTPSDRWQYRNALALNHVPILNVSVTLNGWSREDILKAAEGESSLNPKTEREGVVYKAHGMDVSFKAISNKFLLKDKS